MKNAEYWENRFSQLEEAQHKLLTADKAEIEKQYAQTQQILDGQIALWYQKFADNNKITLAEAKQYVQGDALAELKWNVHEYIQYGKDSAVTGNWKKELQNASAKFHITKLEALKIQTQQSLENLFAQIDGTVTGSMGNTYKSGYYHTAFELQKGFGVGFDIVSVDQSQLVKILSKPWADDKYNFSQRIWGYKNQLISTVHNILSENIRQGSDPSKAIKQIAAAMHNSEFNAGRLVMTEGAYFSSLSQRDCFEELGVKKYEIVATLDDRTSEKCISLDGKVFSLEDYKAGDTAPPFHCFCRSTTAPYLDYDLKLSERAARDGDGKTYYVPGDMRYSEWKAKYVDKTEEKPAPQEKPQAVPKVESKPQSVPKSQPKAEIKATQKDDVSELNLKATETLKKNYEENRKHFDLNLMSADEVKGNWVNYDGLSQEVAEKVNAVLEKLQSEYYSTLVDINVEHLGKFTGIVAETTPSGFAASSSFTLNSDIVKDSKAVSEIVRYNMTPKRNKLVAHAVEIEEGKEEEYFITHEFAHSIYTTRTRKELTAIYGEETAKKLDSMQRKMKSIYSAYCNEVKEAQHDFSEISRKLESMDDISDDDFIDLLTRQKEALNKVNKIKISEYAETDVNEFMAESFTQMRIGKSRSPYAEQAGELLDSVFKKSAEAIDKSVESGIIKVDKVFSGHSGTPKKYKPNTVADHVTNDGIVDKRSFYGDDALKSKDIHTTDHKQPNQHKYGEHGEHAHDYEWDNEEKLKNKTTRELTEDECRENGDIL